MTPFAVDTTVTKEAPLSSENSITDTKSETLTISSYVANKNTKKVHYPSCSSVGDMKEKNKLYFDGTRDELIEHRDMYHARDSILDAI